jgi:hypothetical protein
MEQNIGIRWQFVISVAVLIGASALFGAGYAVLGVVFVLAALYFPVMQLFAADPDLAGLDDDSDDEIVDGIVAQIDLAADELRRWRPGDPSPTIAELPLLTPEQFSSLSADEANRLGRQALATALRSAAHLLDVAPVMFSRLFGSMRTLVAQAVAANIIPITDWVAWSQNRGEFGVINEETRVPTFTAFLRDTAEFVDDSTAWLEKHVAKPTDIIPPPTVFVHPGVAAAMFGGAVNGQKGVA